MGQQMIVLYNQESWIPLTFISKCLRSLKSTADVTRVLFQYTNLCIYSLMGLCLHPECNAGHDSDLRSILRTYFRQRKSMFIWKIMEGGTGTKYLMCKTPSINRFLDKLLPKDKFSRSSLSRRQQEEMPHVVHTPKHHSLSYSIAR